MVAALLLLLMSPLVVTRLQVGVLKPDNTVELRDIKVGRDFGISIEATGGLTPSDKIVNNPPDSLVSGTLVHVATTSATSPSPAMAKK